MSFVVSDRRSRRRTRRLAKRLAGLALLAMLFGAGSWHLAPSSMPESAPATSAAVALPASASIALPASAELSGAADVAPATVWSRPVAPQGAIEDLAPSLSGTAWDSAPLLADDAGRSGNGTRAPPHHSV